MAKTSSYLSKLHKISNIIQDLTQKDKYVSTPYRWRPKRERALAKAYKQREEWAIEFPDAPKLPKPMHPSKKVKKVTLNAQGENISRRDAQLILLTMRQTADAMTRAFKAYGEAATIEGNVGYHNVRDSDDFLEVSAYGQNAGIIDEDSMKDELSYDDPKPAEDVKVPDEEVVTTTTTTTTVTRQRYETPSPEPDHISETDSSEDDEHSDNSE